MQTIISYWGFADLVCRIFVFFTKIQAKIFFFIWTTCKKNGHHFAVMLCLLADSKTYVVNCCCANCERRERVGPWGSTIHAYYRIQHFLWRLPLCRAGLLNMLPCLLKVYVEVQILHKWNAGPFSDLYFTRSIPALEFNICFSWIFVWRKHNSSELNVQLKDFLNSNGLKWSLSLIPMSSLLSSAEVFLYLYKANFLWPDKNFFKAILLHVLTK